MNRCSLLFCILIFSISNALDFSYVTSGINLKRLSGDLSIAAVADLNSDRYSDLLLVNKSVKGINTGTPLIESYIYIYIYMNGRCMEGLLDE